MNTLNTDMGGIMKTFFPERKKPKKHHHENVTYKFKFSGNSMRLTSKKEIDILNTGILVPGQEFHHKLHH